MWPISLSTKFFLIVIASLTFALGASMLYGRALKAELGEKTAVIEYMQREAETFAERSDQIAKETNSAFTQLVEQIKDKNLAISNAKKRFGNAACGIRANGLLVPASAGETHGAGEPDGPLAERLAVSREFINDCALDAGRLDAWRSWAVKNELPISKE